MEVVEMINILDNIEVLYHSCIKINKEKIIYIDPYHIDKNYNDAENLILFLLFLMIYYLNYLKKE